MRLPYPYPYPSTVVPSSTSCKKKMANAFANLVRNSASPLNGQAAELWDNNPAEFKKHVLARHQDLEDE